MNGAVSAVVTYVALAWGLIVETTGGFDLSLGWFRFSSHSPRNPFLIALISLAVSWAWRDRTQRGSTWFAARERGWASATAAVVAVALVFIGLTKGAHVAGAADSYGYVSQAHLWATGNLRPAAPGYELLPAGVSSDALVPLGYRFASDRAALVPVYAPGLPLQMALFEWLGGPSAVFYVMPLLAGLAVWGTYALGARAGGRRVGAVAALLLAASPTLLFQLTHAPMSDLPAAAWWTVALALLVRPSRAAALLCGIAAGAAILTRPNLVPLAIIPGASLLWSALRSSDTGGRAWQRLALFAAGSIPACVAIGVLNAYWYGSPFLSGYGDLTGTMYHWGHFRLNAQRYAVWILETQGPTVALAALAPAVFLWARGNDDAYVAQRRLVVAVSALFVVTVWASYVFYMPFEAWWTLRFLLPAFPALCVLASAGLFGAAAWVPTALRAQVVTLVLAVALGFSLEVTRTYHALESVAEWRFATMGRSLARSVPPQSVVLASLHSGSARFYAERLTMRWDFIDPRQLDSAVTVLQERGYPTFVLVDDEEAEAFRTRFAGVSRHAALNWEPQLTVPGAALYLLRP